MNVVLSQFASDEIENSKQHYEYKQDNLGFDFKENIRKTIDSIATNPYLYPNITTEIKRAVLHKFPFYIYYSVSNDVIVILSVAHQHRKPLF
jgi:plasmid stabilization system protein ParE